MIVVIMAMPVRHHIIHPTDGVQLRVEGDTAGMTRAPVIGEQQVVTINRVVIIRVQA